MVLAGAIVPHQPVVQHTGETPQGPLSLRVYPGDDCRGSLYLDDGKTYAYSRGEYLRVSYTCQPAPNELRVTLSAYEGRYKPWWRSVRLEVFGVEKPPKSLRAGERELRELAIRCAAKECHPDPAPVLSGRHHPVCLLGRDVTGGLVHPS